MFMKNQRLKGLILFAAVLTFGPLAMSGAQGAEKLGDLHPGLSQGLIRNAGFDELESGLVSTAGSEVVTLENLEELIEREHVDLREELGRNLLFVLDQHLMRLILRAEATREGIPETVTEDEAIERLFKKKTASISVDESELRPAYEAFGDMLAHIPFDQVKEDLRDYLLKEKQSRAIGSYLSSLGTDVDIKVDREWAEEQAAIMLDNPVDRARASGVPTLVDFGDPGCGHCVEMKPIIEDVKKKYAGRLNVVSIRLGEYQVLGARYGISSIPVQAFYDGSGAEVARHVGFLPKDELEKVLYEIGITL